MAGRNTSKNLHPTKNIFGNTKTTFVSDEVFNSLLMLSGMRNENEERSYESNELSIRNYLTSQCSLIADFYQHNDVTRQDIKRTIEAIAKLPASAAIEALKNADVVTTAYIEGHILSNRDKQNPVTLDFSGENIVRAAQLVIRTNIFPKPHAGRPTKASANTRIAELCLDIWCLLSAEKKPKVWRYEENESNFLRFSSAIYAIINRRPAPHDFIDYLKILTR